jgi:hypothetical protein
MKSCYLKIFCVLILVGCSETISGQIDNIKKSDSFSDIYAPAGNSSGTKKIDFIDPYRDEQVFEKSLAREIEKKIQEKELRDLKENNVLTPQQLFEKRYNAEAWGSKKKYAIIDKNLGVLENRTETITIVCRDFGAEDGDIVQVNQNNNTVIRQIELTRRYQKFTLSLRPGVNRIEFLARNEGLYSPNTAGFMIFDENGEQLLQNDWFLATGATAFFTIVRTPKK